MKKAHRPSGRRGEHDDIRKLRFCDARRRCARHQEMPFPAQIESVQWAPWLGAAADGDGAVAGAGFHRRLRSIGRRPARGALLRQLRFTATTVMVTAVYGYGGCGYGLWRCGGLLCGGGLPITPLPAPVYYGGYYGGGWGYGGGLGLIAADWYGRW